MAVNLELPSALQNAPTGPVVINRNLLVGRSPFNAGRELSAAFHGKALPGCESGYFADCAPDIGAFEVK